MCPQVGFMAGPDQKSIQLEKRQLARRRISNDAEIEKALEQSSDSSFSEDESIDEFVLPTRTSTPRQSSVSIEIPVRTLLKDTSMVTDRCQISIRSQLAIASKIITLGGGNLSDISISKSTAHRQRKRKREEAAKEIYNDWMKNKPPFLVVHWDSKLIVKQQGQSNERVSILVSGKPYLDTPKLLGVPIISDSTGLSQKNAVSDLLSTWKITESVIGLVFDTTASNTGIHRGCATLLEKELGRAIMWLACRHHIYELHVKHVWAAVIGEANSPIEPLMKRFQQDWNDLDRGTEGLCLFEWDGDEESDTFQQASKVLKWGENHLMACSFPREDYRELIELTVVYLGGKVPPPRIFNLRKPGAHHRARFMHIAIYALKMQLMSERFKMMGRNLIN
ncbi:hypothetical protein OUZ56_009768 [Daphnia magna]|uniref:Cc8K15.2-like protein n=1 Tax=Daphnia magna TaxID=35525 RepID=A0ABR0AGU3_9CRUS|nr:hypothetical protein OUZ56_009768 [Daphnia magna]